MVVIIKEIEGREHPQRNAVTEALLLRFTMSIAQRDAVAQNSCGTSQEPLTSEQYCGTFLSVCQRTERGEEWHTRR